MSIDTKRAALVKAYEDAHEALALACDAIYDYDEAMGNEEVTGDE